jgi:hypothetical protein
MRLGTVYLVAIWRLIIALQHKLDLSPKNGSKLKDAKRLEKKNLPKWEQVVIKTLS